ncbi:hypothetical protein CKO11_06355 [Rhodobacter sp. TJ_12]|uniref:translocation/assembly module TamB domain-containing protein n=1 Tax=Rhodobacter sp. TJ_12 TaxID=2029399 RepID=UPI001CBD4828|nr:translocation/assembly module TamB domain-containing protein [Rhodobacter sp. TJ_12]MBZ4022078.1 hypothetical protein [Rhodobacter sp. TJ_12]
MRIFAFLLILLLPLQALAQEDQTERDRSYLTGLIEDNLSGAGRSVRLEGFAGALSSRATFDSLTIADDTGVWITVQNGALQWDRGALLRGEILIDELSADSIDLPRLPQSEGAPASPEATPFALPDLPVGVKIGALKVQSVTLGAPVLGQAAAFNVTGSMRLAGGAGETRLKLTRSDGPKGQLSLHASYANTTREALIDLLLSEGPDGIAANLMGLPGTPALSLSLSGLGPLEDFAADVALGTAGQKRLSGKVLLTGTPPGTEGPVESGFNVTLGGDVSPLLPPEYRDFFGDDARLVAVGSRTDTGMMQLRQFELSGAAVRVNGAMDLLPSGLPDRFDLQADVGLEGEAVLLPLSGPETRLRSATLSLGYDRAQGDGWALQGDITGLTQGTGAAQNVIDRVSLSGSGRIGQPVEGSATAGGNVDFGATGMALADPALAEALGSFVTGTAQFFWQDGAPLKLPQLTLRTRDFETTGEVSLADGVVTAKIRADHNHLQSLSQLAGRALSGSISAELSGDYTVLSGAFDADAAITAPDLQLSQPQADALLAGGATITASARRDETGLRLRSLVAKSDALSLNAEGHLTSDANDLTATLELRDLGKLGGGYNGAANAKLVLQGPIGARQVTLSGAGRNLSLAQAQLNHILAGQSRFSVSLAERNGAFQLADLDLNTSQLTASATARTGKESLLDVALRLYNAALLAPGFPGPVTLSGSVDQRANSFGLDLRGTGPGGTEATVKGSAARDFSTTDLAIAGRTESALLNGLIAPRSVRGPLTFDLALRGKPGLSALSGQLRGQGLRVSLPTLGQALENVDLQAQLSGGSASLSGQAAFEGGGTLRLSGPVRLASPFPANLSLVLDRARLRDPQLYDTRVSGNLNVDGGLTGNLRISGALSLAETELRIPSSGLGGAAAIPDITHLHEPAAVRQTRARAGLLQSESDSSGPGRVIALDVSVSAPNQIFVRGRGLDAELGGQLRVTGTTADIVPMGEFNLIRGRLDVLGKRFNLAEGQVALQGALTPWVKFAATTDQDDTAITLTLEGAASEPGLSIASSPELPEEEVLARLLFDKGLTNLSALQAAQLATAVATLAGKGGEGIVSKLRKGFGLDDLDIGTDESGNATVRAGKYIAENVYSDVSVDSNGEAEVTLNLDITKQLTARGSVGSDGASALGLFFEKDY